MAAAGRWRAGLALLAVLLRLGGTAAEQTEEHLKREHSLSKPYQGVGSASSGLWDLLGNAMVMTQFIRLTPDVQSKQGAVWNRVPCYLRDWEMQVHFKIHGQGKKNLNGDGFAIWYTKDRMQPGPVFGSKDNFLGLGVFVDTYPNEEKQQEAQKRRYSPGNQRVFPYISAMVNNGSLTYDHDRDGRPTELGGCTAMVRNLNHDTFLVIRYVKRRLTVLIDIDGKHEWRDCIDVPGVRLPRGYYFGTSSVTGDLSDNHDIISLKLYQLTVERTPEEEKRDREVFLPVVDNLRLPAVSVPCVPLWLVAHSGCLWCRVWQGDTFPCHSHGDVLLELLPAVSLQSLASTSVELPWLFVQRGQAWWGDPSYLWRCCQPPALSWQCHSDPAPVWCCLMSVWTCCPRPAPPGWMLSRCCRGPRPPAPDSQDCVWENCCSGAWELPWLSEDEIPA